MKQSLIDDLLAIAGENIAKRPEASRYIAGLAVKEMKGPRTSKIEWIKWHRQTYGSSLMEAKEAADKEFS